MHKKCHWFPHGHMEQSGEVCKWDRQALAVEEPTRVSRYSIPDLLGWISSDDEDEEGWDGWGSRTADAPKILTPEVFGGVWPSQGGAPAETCYLMEGVPQLGCEGDKWVRKTLTSSPLIFCPRSFWLPPGHFHPCLCPSTVLQAPSVLTAFSLACKARKMNATTLPASQCSRPAPRSPPYTGSTARSQGSSQASAEPAPRTRTAMPAPTPVSEAAVPVPVALVHAFAAAGPAIPWAWLKVMLSVLDPKRAQQFGCKGLNGSSMACPNLTFGFYYIWLLCGTLNTQLVYIAWGFG